MSSNGQWKASDHEIFLNKGHPIYEVLDLFLYQGRYFVVKKRQKEILLWDRGWEFTHLEDLLYLGGYTDSAQQDGHQRRSQLFQGFPGIYFSTSIPGIIQGFCINFPPHSRTQIKEWLNYLQRHQLHWLLIIILQQHMKRNNFSVYQGEKRTF